MLPTRDPAFVPPKHQNVHRLLNNLLEKWNSKFESLEGTTEKNKIKEIANFHHGLLSIHPFVDGNGRLARIILRKQVEQLFNRELELDFSRQEYLNSLREGNKNKFNKLEVINKNALR